MLDIVAPGPRLLVSAAEAQEAMLGDGTSSVVLLGAALVEAAAGLVAAGHQPLELATGLLDAAEASVSLLQGVAAPPDSRLAPTVLSSKLDPASRAAVAHIAEELASVALPGSVLKLLGSDPSASAVYRGVAIGLPDRIAHAWPESQKSVRLVVSDASLQPGFSASLAPSSMAGAEVLAEAGADKLAEALSGAELLVSGPVLPAVLRSGLEAAGVTVIDGLGRPTVTSLAADLDVRPTVDWMLPPIVASTNASRLDLHEGTFLLLGRPESRAGFAVLVSPTAAGAAEMERALDDVVRLRALAGGPVVPGGGWPYLVAASAAEPGPWRQGLLELPRLLIRNAGLPVAPVVAAGLERARVRPIGWFTLDLDGGQLADWEPGCSGPTEPLALVVGILRGAALAAASILRIGSTLVVPPARTAADMGLT